IFGNDHRAIQISQNILFLLAVALFGAVSTRSFGRPVGLLCMLLLIFNPAWLIFPQQGYSETLFVFLLSLGLFLVLPLQSSGGWSRPFFAGLVFGLSALVREIGLYIGVLLAVLAFLWLWRDGARRAGARIALLTVAGIVLAVGPWTVRNYFVLGS